MQELIELIDLGWNISIQNSIKRIDGEWVTRITWKASNGGKERASDWEGFDLTEQCIADMIKTLKK